MSYVYVYGSACVCTHGCRRGWIQKAVIKRLRNISQEHYDFFQQSERAKLYADQDIQLIELSGLRFFRAAITYEQLHLRTLVSLS